MSRREDLAEQLVEIRGRIEAAARAAGRDPAELTLIAVSKTWPAQDVVTLSTLGVRHFAENREQEAGPKVILVTQLASCVDGEQMHGPSAGPGVPTSADLSGDLVSTPPTWHFVGQLQRNKARSILRWADWVQSVDRPSVVPVLSRLAVERGRPLSVCIQVSLDQPVSAGGSPGTGPAGPADAGIGRGGVDPAGLPALAELIAQADSLTLRGVMAVAPRGAPPRPAFARLHDVAARLRADHPAATVISAGMSGDLEAAVAEGATHLRIGTALFGERRGVP